ncbi:DUF6090 family protein [Algoriphagus formosus]|uniref:Uncharacterized protein n=1 Tax=Algoriphagus formosus TaxID=2007308 RepID=A0A4R5UZN9_9BACT|nr:DUF6090 family protein [Algoriphagus aquimaris]TDK44882.1 hypothetical protein E1898_09930 [Algoriphagus aquimaris]
MSRLFRKFRQEIISKGKIQKYLLYALGEVVLLVIGIMIALAINNNNVINQNRVKEQVYLKGLKEDFQISQSKLQELIKVNRNNLENAKKIIQADPKDSNLLESQFSQWVFEALAFEISFSPNNSLLMEMINSGSLKDVSNPDLRKSLTDWLANLEDIHSQENELSIQREKVINVFDEEGYSIRKVFEDAGVTQELGISKGDFSGSNLQILESVSFENRLLIFILTTQATEEAHYLPLMDKLESILALIEKEID